MKPRSLSLHSRQLAAVLFLALSLLGVQAIQGSVLHDHQQHSVDCALCHFHLGDDTEHPPRPPAPVASTPHVVAIGDIIAPEAPAGSPYKSRAPPLT